MKTSNHTKETIPTRLQSETVMQQFRETSNYLAMKRTQLKQKDSFLQSSKVARKMVHLRIEWQN